MKVKNLEEFHKIVCQRDMYQDQITRKAYDHPCWFNEDGKNTMVCGHHLHSRGARPDLALETDNGICVNWTTHNAIHRGEYKDKLDLIKKQRNL